LTVCPIPSPVTTNSKIASIYSSLVSHQLHALPTPPPSITTMPVAQDWRSTPLQLVEKVFEDRTGQVPQGEPQPWHQQVTAFFKNRVEEPGALASIPSLNDVLNHELADGQLVRFRAMVQDMFDPEFYLSQYQVRNLSTGEIRTVSGRYRDIAPCGPREELMTDTDKCQTGDRLAFYCVSLPGEAPWVTQAYKTKSQSKAGPSGTHTNPLKRELETETDDIEMDEGGDQTHQALDITEIKKNKTEALLAVENGGDKIKNGNNIQKIRSNTVSLNHPIPGSNGKAAIVKMYDVKDGDIKLNDMLEVVGVISLDPSLASFTEEESDHASPQLPPPSLVPRIHALYHTKLPHNNPLIPDKPAMPLEEAADARKELHAILTEALLGDSVAADYLICHLISRVYLRKDILTLGKLSLNIHNMTSHDNWPKRLATLIQLLTTSSHLLTLSLANLNSLPFIPKKDFEGNRLVSGLLQMPDGTHLIIDETSMTDGQLDQAGLKNLTALGHLITWQKVEYDFKFHLMEYQADVPCLVLSEGRSMLPSDIQLMIKPSCAADPAVISEKFSSIGGYLTVPLLTKLRAYITSMRMQDFTLTDETQRAVQDDFVSMRHQQEGGANSANMSVEDLHQHLVLARLVSLSNGRTSLDPSDWEKCKSMEAIRKERASTLPPRNGAPGSVNTNGVHIQMPNVTQ